jgi:hypothetical protein
LKHGPVEETIMATQSTFNNPLSGSVTQMFDFLNSWFRSIGGQFGLVNITVGSTANPEAEKRILEGVGTYGRQLGRIGDALRVLVDHMDKRSLKEDQKKALTAFLYQVEQVDEIKKK